MTSAIAGNRIAFGLIGLTLSACFDTGQASACPSGSEGVARGTAPGPIRMTPRGGPEEIGRWLSPVDWPTIAIHAALMPNGEVLHYSYPADSSGSDAILWNPTTDKFTQVDGFTDIFCSGLTHLESGLLYVAGGNRTNCDFQGRRVTFSLDAATRIWTSLGPMTTSRWYPNTMKLGDGTVLITSGLNDDCETTTIMEMYTPNTGLETIPEGERFISLFPHMHLLTSGKMAHVGPEELTATFDPATRDWATVAFSNYGYRDWGTSVLLPGRIDTVLSMGGYSGGVPTDESEILDFNDSEAGWQPTGGYNLARAHANAVILPDRSVIVIGGGTFDLYGGPVLNMELYDVDTGQWTLGPAQVYGRMYHSTTLLLPDGRVLSAGQDDGDSAYKAEIYEPPYLFRGDRPVMDSAPTVIGYGQSFLVETAQAEEIGAVVLMGLGSLTHSFDTNQRLVDLSYTISPENELNCIAVSDGNQAPPGYYMLFIVNLDGIPSEARFVQLTQTPPPPPACEGDANGDGLVDPLDYGFILARFGCVVGSGEDECDASDVNEDGFVDPLDAGFVLARFGECL